MDRGNNESSSDAESTNKSVNFSHVNTVATGWMLDFMFVGLCRRFRDGKLEEFNETLKIFEAISQSKSLKRNCHKEKILLCAFLARVMHGKQLDVVFEEDESVMPLMSAAKIWSKLKQTVADETLFKKIAVLLLVQSVALCLEKGQRSSASSTLQWFEKHQEFPQKIRVKLSAVVAQMETYDPFLTSYSFQHLQETIQSFLDSYLEENPSDYLLKVATKVVQSQDTEDLEEVTSLDSSVPKTPDKSQQKKRKMKRKLLSTQMTDVWRPDSAKKPRVSLTRLSITDLSKIPSGKSPETSPVHKTSKPKTSIPKKKWTFHLDKYLKQGVKVHGQGKWARILMDYDFEGRTAVMLKDRWRVLVRTHQVS
ncbi:unnamed protein product [Menidia menidia]|uniref:Telomeric repeat-binding factor n=1 Tax=Menidia menidia TaxID=238744 RepID=A0A8S4ATK6_9TELE|nr:unnamed protein product [Menidia menidia]